MNLALAGLFAMLSIIGVVIYGHTGDQFAALGAAGFAVASILATTSILKGYKGGKRQ